MNGSWYEWKTRLEQVQRFWHRVMTSPLSVRMIDRWHRPPVVRDRPVGRFWASRAATSLMAPARWRGRPGRLPGPLRRCWHATSVDQEPPSRRRPTSFSRHFAGVSVVVSMGIGQQQLAFQSELLLITQTGLGTLRKVPTGHKQG